MGVKCYSPLGLMATARQFFFFVMKDGYATSPEKGTIPELPGSKTITFEDDEKNLKLVDCWFVTPNSYKSWGFTQIFYRWSEVTDWVPVWTMQYWGEYKPEAIKFLKEALAASYLNPSSERFDGCRGPREFSCEGDGCEGLFYQNLVKEESTFAKFSGREGIFKTDVGLMGWHEYQGWSLIPGC